MKKSLVRLSTTLGIVGISILSSGLYQLKAWALPNEQIVEILNPVPVFTIANEEGVTLTLTITPNSEQPESSEKKPEQSAVVVFMSQQQANEFINTKLKTENPELASSVSVNPVPLGKIFEESQKKGVQLTYVPTQESLTSAQGILEGEGKKYQGGVPLFFVKDKNNGQPFLFGNDSKQVFPLFFEKNRLDETVAQVSQQDPKFADSVGVEVIPLEQVIATLQKDDDEALTKIELVISAESQEFIRNLSNSTGTAPANPAPGGK